MRVNERAGWRVLVIDDDELSREVLGLLLSGEGYEVESASCGEDALAELAGPGAKPDAVLMDLQMPGVSGEGLARLLRRACGPEMRLLAMSGSRSGLGESEVFDAFLLKPFSMGEFGATLERLEVRAARVEPRQAAVTPEADEVLDAQIFNGFAGMMSAGPLKELYGVCLTDAVKQMEAMREAATIGDDAAFRKNAHAIKGSLGMVGARELQGMCALLEEMGLAGDTYVKTLADFGEAIQRLRGMLVARGVSLEEIQPRS